MKLAEVMEGKTPDALRALASRIVTSAMRDWVDSKEYPDRKRQAQVLRGQVLDIVAAAAEKATELEQLSIGGDVDLQLLLRDVVRSGRAHLGVQFGALQGVLDLLDRIDALKPDNGTEDARSNNLLRLAEQLVADSKKVIEFHLPQTAVERTLGAIRLTLKPTLTDEALAAQARNPV